MPETQLLYIYIPFCISCDKMHVPERRRIDLSIGQGVVVPPEYVDHCGSGLKAREQEV